VHLVDSDITGEAVLARIVKSKNEPVLFYCNGVKCGRAANATAKAVSWGYTKVYYYALGMAQWKERGCLSCADNFRAPIETHPP